ncbi:MAG: corrinoid protein [Anaerolineales bacterium]|jgi:corrinoid protein of di/trimethylamine methyltransferase|uniref:corrinoid protein n=1 Tax=Candidatus Villigracilis affinis TaxID=3140682 RepID=UPI001B52645E|nr:corrinoid protein [Anaerolineales bacterium]MBK9603005.1 corrinoid protein [Anaerolineales bacterium]MBL0346182.1 corrinoid protein [Anaerolineales bacterium]MBP8048154.1 corrinoid protein [Anaerolineales bacterium]
MPESTHLQAIATAIIDGEAEDAMEATKAALEDNVDPMEILNRGLMDAADEVGKRFERSEYFLPELMLTGRALKGAMEIVKPVLLEKYADNDSQVKGKVVSATVHTDIHDIGKNIVSSMLTAAGFEVTDMGVDVPIKSIIDKAEEIEARVICLSALLTTSMPFMKDLIQLLDARGIRQKYIVLVGGASVTESWAMHIGADGTARNAADAVKLARAKIGA